jgi:hypothetical protein
MHRTHYADAGLCTRACPHYPVYYAYMEVDRTTKHSM